jgi:hypothetical protein
VGGEKSTTSLLFYTKTRAFQTATFIIIIDLTPISYLAMRNF